MIKRRSPEITVNHERWLVSYADFMTLLFAFFVVMYAVSQMHENKYRELSDTLNELFVGDKTEQTVADTTATESMTAAQLNSNPESISTLSSELTEKQEEQPLANIDELSEQLSHHLESIDDDLITVTSNEQWLQISLNNRVLFPLGSVILNAEAKAVLSDIASVLKGVANPIQVEGFTDNLSISSTRFPSNWELSSARAIAVLKQLKDSGVRPERLSAVGYGEFHPVADNSTTAGRSKNRRVVLMIAQKSHQRPEWQSLPRANVSDAATIDLTATENTESSADETKPTNNNSAGEQKENTNNITPITLEDGDLLFTSDPDLPRASR